MSFSWASLCNGPMTSWNLAFCSSVSLTACMAAFHTSGPFSPSALAALMASSRAFC